MIRNFVAGSLWGVVVAGVGLGVVSQVAPMPGDRLGVDAGQSAVAGKDPVVPAKPDAPKPDAPKPDVAKPVLPKADAVPVAPSAATPAPADVADSAGAMPPELPAASPLQPRASDPKSPDPGLPAQAQVPAPSKTTAAALPAESLSDEKLALGDAVTVPKATADLPDAARPNVADAPPVLNAPGAVAVDPVPIAPDDPALTVMPAADLPAADLPAADLPAADLPAADLPAADGPAADQTDAMPDTSDTPPPIPEALLDAAPGIKTNPAPATIVPDDPASLPQAAPTAPAADTPAAEVAVTDPAFDPTTQPEPQPDGAVLQPVTPPEPAPSLIAKDQPSTFLPDAGAASAVDGVTTGRLPRIGDQPAETAEAAAVELPPVQQFAQDFDNPSGKPLFAVILRDTGGADVDRATLAALPFPVSFVIDPLAPNAIEAAAIYRAAGQEVIMLASGIPQGAQASDLEQTFQSLGAVLPQAVAVMDLATAGFQDDRPLASLVVPLLKNQGRGLITFNRGLNAADQVARRIDVPAATIFRHLDGAGEDLPLIRRYLDRAAFKAAQEGRVMVLGDTRPTTIAALIEWTVEGRASSVTLAPATAVLSID